MRHCKLRDETVTCADADHISAAVAVDHGGSLPLNAYTRSANIKPTAVHALYDQASACQCDLDSGCQRTGRLIGEADAAEVYEGAGRRGPGEAGVGAGVEHEVVKAEVPGRIGGWRVDGGGESSEGRGGGESAEDQERRC